MLPRTNNRTSTWIVIETESGLDRRGVGGRTVVSFQERLDATGAGCDDPAMPTEAGLVSSCA
jgi:hypothetical protein